MSVINTNVKALYTQAALKGTGRASAEAMQQLSTGKRINSAKDDAAGLAIATRMTQQIRSLNQAMRNAGDAVSLIQTAEGSTSAITSMLQRMRELSIQAINDTNADDQRGYLDVEFQQLKQEIVRIADTTEWNGFPILNGSAGERVGERPVYKATSAGTFNSAIAYAAGTVTKTAHTGAVTLSANLAKAGTVSITATSATAATATLTLSDGTQSTITGGVVSAADKTITFTDSSLTNGTGDFVLTSDATIASGSGFSFNVSRSFTPVAALQSNDIQINGVTIGASYAESDKLSPAGSAAGSAIARAAAINAASVATGVAAVVNGNVMTGTAMPTGLNAASGTVTINGFTSAPITTVANNTRESRMAVVNAINAITFQTGVTAVDTNSDSQGIVLKAADGRNIELAFNTTSSTSDFASRTGLREGLQVGTYSLETKVEGQMKVTSSGNWERAGLKPADYTVNQAVINTAVRPEVTSAANIKTLGVGDLVINGVAIRAALPSDDRNTNTQSLTSSASGSATAIAAAINSSSAETGVTARANTVSTAGTTTTIANNVSGLQSLFINGVNVQVDFATTDTEPERRVKVIDAVNAFSGMHGVTASQSDTGVKLSTLDGRNLSVWYDSSVTGLNAAGFGLGVVSGGNPADPAGVRGATGAGASYTGAYTLYGSVSLVGDPAPKQPPAGTAPSNGAQPPYVSKTFTVEPGVNGYISGEGDFASLGFQVGTFGGDVNEATSKMTPPRTGRLSFHVGASANQTITIDLADFGKDGPITGAITGDSGKNPPDVHIGDREAAKSVLAKLDFAMDKVNATRATMGAVMNRLEHVIDNLSNVSMNTEASRSQIEDADYAAASTELSRTQIMTQAATAMLAQANTDQQTVLKLLQ